MNLITSFENFKINELYLSNSLYSKTKRHILVGLETQYDIILRKIVGKDIFSGKAKGFNIEIEFDKNKMVVTYRILKNGDLLVSKEFSLYENEIDDDFIHSLYKSLSI